MNHLYLDIEAASGVKLSQTGPYRYSEDEHFRILLFGYAVDNEPIRIINLEHGERIPSEVIEALTDPGVKKIAYDAEYERICLSRYLKLPGNNYLCPEHWNCLRVWASYRGLPSTMKKIATLLNLDSAANPEVQLLLRDKYLHDPRVHGDQEPERQEKMLMSLHALGQCIRQNLMAERELHAYLQQYPMPDTEWVFYFMDQRINDPISQRSWELEHIRLHGGWQARLLFGICQSFPEGRLFCTGGFFGEHRSGQSTLLWFRRSWRPDGSLLPRLFR